MYSTHRTAVIAPQQRTYCTLFQKRRGISFHGKKCNCEDLPLNNTVLYFFSFHGEKSKDHGKHYPSAKEIVHCFLP